MEAFSCIGIHPKYFEIVGDAPLCIEEYLAWVLKNEMEFPQAICRDGYECDLVIREISRMGFYAIKVPGYVPDNFEGWNFVQPIDPKNFVAKGNELSHKSEIVDSPKYENNVVEPWGYYKYLEGNGGKERYDFSTPDEAYNFGQELRRNIAKEFYTGKIEVSISNSVVRAKIVS